MRELLIEKSKEFAECVANRINELSKCSDDFSVSIDTCNDMSNPACFYPNTGIVSINEKYFEERYLQENQEVFDCLLESTIAHEMLHVYLKNIKNVSLEEVLLFYPECLQFIGKKIDEDVLDNFIHHLFIPKLIDILGYDNGVFFNAISEINKNLNNLENAIALSLDFWFNDKVQNKSRDDYILDREKYINVDIFNKCCDFLEKFPFDDIEFDSDNQNFFKPLAVLFDDIYQYIVAKG